MGTQTKKKLLIVEDEIVNIEIYKSMLPDVYDLLIAENGEQALDIIQVTAVDLLLLDVMLPDCSGFDICRKFKASSSRIHIPVIMVTALNSPDDKIKGLEAGANDFLSKPVDKHELLLKIKNQLNLLDQYNIIKEQKEEINKYIGVMVHDLKNPLSVVGGYAELIGNFTTDERLKKYTSKIQASAQDMLDSINRILDFRKIEASSFDVKLEAFDLVESIKQITNGWQALAQDKGILIDPCFSTDKSYVVGDKEKLKNIIDNLLSNAFKFSQAKTIITIISENLPNGFARVTFKDQGVGLTETELENIFTRFAGSTKNPDGSRKSQGLGLILCKRLVESMGGEIGAASEGENKGAAFWFTLKTTDRL